MNPFDQFDQGASAPSAQEPGVASATTNPFDAFDKPSLEDSYSNLWSKTKKEIHGIEDATNRVAAGGIGFAAALLPTAAHRINEHIQGRGNQSSFEQDFNVLSDKIAKNLVPSIEQEAPPEAEKYNDFASDAFNRIGFASIGVHGAIPYAKNMPKPKELKAPPTKFDALAKLDEGAAKAATNPFDQFDSGSKAMNAIVENQTTGWNEPVRNNGTGNGIDTVVSQAEAMRQSQAQAVLDARQKAMEYEVQRQAALDNGASLRARQEAAPVPGLEEARSREVDQSIARTQELNQRGSQMEIDPTPEGYKADQYGGGQDGLRIDENGMPIRADRSMEAANLENPLQRNLWGDELPRQSEQEATRGITAAIDRMPAGEARQSGIDMLSNGPRSRQRGSAPWINDLADLLIKKTPEGFEAHRNGEKVGYLKSNLTPEQSKMLGENANIDIVKANKGQGIGSALYSAWNEAHEGRIAPSGKTTQDAWNVWKRNYPEKVDEFISQEATRLRNGAPRSVVLENITDPGIRRQVAEQASFVVPKNQRGSAPIINDIAKGLMKGVDSLRAASESLGLSGLHHMTSKEDYIAKNIPGMKESLDNRISPAPKAADIVAQAMDPKVQDIPKQGIISSNIQSGLQQMSTKYRDNPVLLGAGRILDNMYTKTEYQIKQLVQPVMEHMQKLSSKERTELTQLFSREMFMDKRYTKEQLTEAGFSNKQVDAYDMLRAAHDEAFNVNNRGRELLGKDPITKSNAYLASIRQGDWQFSVLDKNGKAAWFVRSNTKAEAFAAIEHLKKQFGDTLQMEKVEPQYRKDSSKYHPDTPRDVMGAYQDMLRYFTDNPAVSSAVRESMQGFAEQKGYDFAGHKQRFMDKANVRGFEGDKPWLSESANSTALLKAQENYLKNSIQWNHAQEAMANIKELMSNEDLVKKMPNAIDMVQKTFDGNFGMNSGVLKAVENTLSQILPGYSNGKVAMGRSSSGLYKGTSGLKTALYLQLLGLNLTHMIATPIQGLITAPANHAYLTGKGFGHNVFKTTMHAMSDFSTGMMKHLLHDMTGKDVSLPMTPLGERALKFAEDNNIIDKNLFNESVDLGSGPIKEAAKTIGGFTIALPEKVTRLATFMSFAHHLAESGKLTEMEVFQKAKEFTDNSLTGFGKQDRPMVVNKLGATGSLAYTFKSYLFNYFNQLSTHSRQAAQGNVKPLIYNLGMLAAVGGVLSVPMVNEADGAWNLFKEFVATHAPEHYNVVKGRGLKEQIITHLPDIASYGAASKLTGIGMQNKFGTDIADPEHLLKGVFPMGQDIKEAVSAVGALGHPNSTSLTEAAYQQMPKLIQGQMEKHMDVFKGPQQAGGQIAYNPNKLMEPTPIDHLRTESDWNKRALGMTSLEEAKDRQTGYANSQESFRIKEATKTLGAHIFDAAVTRKDYADTRSEIIAYLKLNPDGEELKRDFTTRLNNAVLTPSQRQLIAAKTFQQVDNVMRLRATRGQK